MAGNLDGSLDVRWHTPAVSSVHDGGGHRASPARELPRTPCRSRCRRARWARSRAARWRSASATSSGCPSRRRRPRARARSSTLPFSTSCGGPAAERTIEAALADLARAEAEVAAASRLRPPRAHRRGAEPRSTPTPRCSCAATSRWKTRATSRVLGVELRARASRAGGVTIRGIIDRLELDADGELVVTDYKTGSAPSEGWEQKSMAGVHIYSLLCERMFGRRPAGAAALSQRTGDDHHDPHRTVRPGARTQGPCGVVRDRTSLRARQLQAEAVAAVRLVCLPVPLPRSVATRVMSRPSGWRPTRPSYRCP